MSDVSLMIHGGAGAIHDPHRYDASLRAIVESGASLLAKGSSALEAVVHCVALLEDDPLFNAGRGSVLNAEGAVLCDASIMDGRQLKAGAVAAVRGVRNPVRLAYQVMEKSGHVLLVGAGAERFAREQHLAIECEDYFRTEERVAQLAKAKKHEIALDHSDATDAKLGTVGAVSRDRNGDLAAATSTGGVVNQRAGRVGDSPLIGAGTFADNVSCAVSCTGVGEDFIRTALARTAACFVEFHSMQAEEAARAAIRYLVDRVDGRGGLILVDRDGRCGRAHATPGMLTATFVEGVVRVETI
ncbi:isoaspartyl peptidase/L-asparaginase family protein [Methylocystis sp.]|uniref:isoaspartyl peptidase/L-asparaginase family protein n=1 Tax=Methylocystis sp. TaxID=1911079 RepID=UPI002734448E|nr:isoaspartyl peptidase/L-asparaginase family protein [Methylocystis sp.]MDP3553234.1 isoaspartyl peptidase/L-asparaginase family protein [Methylocystis sp.]